MNRIILSAGSYLAHSPIPVLILNEQGSLLSWNDAASQLFPDLKKGLAEHEGLSITSTILRKLTPEETIRLEYLLSDRIPFFEFDFSLPGEEGIRQFLKLIVNRQEDNRYLALVIDISREKIKEMHLIQAKETAEKASISRNQFLANISHEIRTPIQTIIGMMELLADTKLDEEQTEYVRQVRFSADVLLTLVNDILDISKVEAGQLKIERIEFNLIDTIERSVDLVSMEAHKKGLEISLDISSDLPVLALGDPGRLQQVILNLVKNAVKFTTIGQIVVKVEPRLREIALTLPGQTGESIHFEIIDTGIGIKPEVRDKLFTQFFQADSSTTRRFGGTGLGLAISRNIVELMEGSIGVRDNLPNGSIFWFDIPLHRSETPAPQEVLPLDHRTRFLLVDDNVQTLSILTRMLVSMGYTDITLATSGQACLDKMLSACHGGYPYDIVFIDMVMPEMDGWRLAGEINGNTEINKVQLYLMVQEGSFGAEAKMKLLEWFNGYLYKPVKRRMLVDLLREHWQASIDLEVVEELEPVEEAEETPAGGAAGAAGGAASGRADRTAEGKAPDAANAAKDAPKGDSKMEPSGLPGKGLTVMVVEDHPVNRKLLGIFLEKAGATVIMAEDGVEATECIQKNRIDLIFMDIQMPRMNGYEASGWMRNHGYKQPIIACTASAHENEKEQCLSFGMTDIMPKPYKRQEVLDILQDFASKKAEKQMETPQTSIFDPDQFLDIMSGDADSAKLLIREYLEQTEAHIGLLEQNIQRSDADHVRQTAHMIKGSSLNMTASKVAEAALAIEKAGPDASRELLDGYFAALRGEFSRLKETLKAAGYAE